MNGEKTIPVTIHGCKEGKDCLNAFGCNGCPNYMGPIQTLDVPTDVLKKGKVLDYVNRHNATNSEVVETVECKNPIYFMRF